MVHKKICSTDSEYIAEVCKKSGLEVPFMRLPELATDQAPIKDVIREALRFYSDRGENYSHILLLQATSPTVTESDIEKAIAVATSTDADTVISCYEHENEHPSLMYYHSDAYLQPVEQKFHQKRRQEHPPVLVRTGLLYLIKISSFLASDDLIGKKVSCIKVEKERAIAIDTMSDWIRCEQYLEKS